MPVNKHKRESVTALLLVSVLFCTIQTTTARASDRYTMAPGVYTMVLTKIIKRNGSIKNLERKRTVYVAISNTGELRISNATMKGKPKKNVFIQGKLKKGKFKGKFREGGQKFIKGGQSIKVTGKLIARNTLQGNIHHPRIDPAHGFLEMRISLMQ